MLPPESNGLFGCGSTFYAFGYGHVIGYTGASGMRVGNIVGEVKAIAESGPNDLWAAMLTGGLRHWNGTRWDKQSIAGATEAFYGVWARAADDVGAAGSGGIVAHYGL